MTETQKRISLAVYLLIPVLGFLAYSNTFTVPFQYDDVSELEWDSSIRQFPDVAPVWESRKTRFLTYVSFALNYRLHGLDVSGFHLFNILIHLTAALLLAFFVRRLFETPAMKADRGTFPDAAAVAAGLIFAVHPVQTEAVTYIVQRAASLAGLFSFLTLWLYQQARFSGRRPAYAAAWFSALAAMFTKETAFTLPVAIVLYDLIFWPGEEDGRKRKIVRWLPFLMLLGVIPVLIFFYSPIRFAGDLFGSRQTDLISRKDYLLTQFNVIAKYVQLILFPAGQNIDYDFPIVKKISDRGTLVSAAAILAVFVTAFRMIRREPLIAFSIFWFFLALAVESSFIPIQDVIAERRLYIPLAGACLFMAVVLFRALGHQKRGWLVLILIAVLLSGATYRRNEIWKSGAALWQDAVNKSPRKARPYHNLAHHLSRKGQFEEAMRYCARAMQIDPAYPDPYITLGLIYGNLGRYGEQIQLFEHAEKLGVPTPNEFYNNFGVAVAAKGDSARAIQHFERSIREKPTAIAFNNMGLTFARQGNGERALEFYEKAMRLDPRNAQAYYLAGVARIQKGEIDQSIRDFERARDRDPKNPNIYNNLGVAWGQKGNLIRMIENYEKALEFNPEFVPVIRNLVQAYRAKGDRVKAEMYERLADSLAAKKSDAYADQTVDLPAPSKSAQTDFLD